MSFHVAFKAKVSNAGKICCLKYDWSVIDNHTIYVETLQTSTGKGRKFLSSL